jgi:hypothetical protein
MKIILFVVMILYVCCVDPICLFRLTFVSVCIRHSDVCYRLAPKLFSDKNILINKILPRGLSLKFEKVFFFTEFKSIWFAIFIIKPTTLPTFWSIHKKIYLSIFCHWEVRVHIQTIVPFNIRIFAMLNTFLCCFTNLFNIKLSFVFYCF